MIRNKDKKQIKVGHLGKTIRWLMDLTHPSQESSQYLDAQIVQGKDSVTLHVQMRGHARKTSLLTTSMPLKTRSTTM